MMSVAIIRTAARRLAVAVILVLASLAAAHAQSRPSAVSAAPDRIIPVEEFSPAFLGLYRKVMEIEDEIRKHTRAYGVDYDLARAVCLYESGGNANLNSWAGARGYFQVMPSTFRLLKVDTNIEAGVKYLSQMVDKFDREDYALAAYNGGPRHVTRGRPPLESLQYVLGVGHFRSVLKLYEAPLREHASRLSLETVRAGDDWWTLSQRTGISVLQLRFHNPFLAVRPLREGYVVAVPPEPRTDLLTRAGDELAYRTRHGDNYFHLASILDVDLDVLRDANGLWRLQTLPAGQVLRVPLRWAGKFDERRVEPGEDVGAVARKLDTDPWRVIRDNELFWDERLAPGTVVKVRAAPPKPTYLTHRVRSGDTISALASRYGTTIGAIQSANNLGRRTTIKVGQRLRIPTY